MDAVGSGEVGLVTVVEIVVETGECFDQLELRYMKLCFNVQGEIVVCKKFGEFW